MLADLSARIKRLEQLSLNLSREELRVSRCELRPHYNERRESLQSIHEAVAGSERARVILTKLLQRLLGDLQGFASLTAGQNGSVRKDRQRCKMPSRDQFLGRPLRRPAKRLGDWKASKGCARGTKVRPNSLTC
jgi:hypothetical protein